MLSRGYFSLHRCTCVDSYVHYLELIIVAFTKNLNQKLTSIFSLEPAIKLWFPVTRSSTCLGSSLPITAQDISRQCENRHHFGAKIKWKLHDIQLYLSALDVLILFRAIMPSIKCVNRTSQTWTRSPGTV